MVLRKHCPRCLSILVRWFLLLLLNHSQIVGHYVAFHARHATVFGQIVAMGVVQIVRYDALCFELLSGIPFYLNNEIEIPFERNSGVLMVHEPVHANERMYDAQQHTSINVCTLFHCTIYERKKKQWVLYQQVANGNLKIM